MGRVLRSKKQSEVDNSENVPVKPTDKNVKVTNGTNKSFKKVLCDRTNANDIVVPKLNSDLISNSWESEENKKAKSSKSNILGSAKVNISKCIANKNIQTKNSCFNLSSSKEVLPDYTNINDNDCNKSIINRQVKFSSKDSQNVKLTRKNLQISNTDNHSEVEIFCKKTSPTMQKPYTLKPKQVLSDCTNLNDCKGTVVENNFKVARFNSTENGNVKLNDFIVIKENNIKLTKSDPSESRNSKLNECIGVKENLNVEKSNTDENIKETKPIRRTRLRLSKDKCATSEALISATSTIVKKNKKGNLKSSEQALKGKTIVKSQVDVPHSSHLSTSLNKAEVNSPFLGFKAAVKSPLIDSINKFINNSYNSSKAHLPIYKTTKHSPITALNKAELYEFEVDENEPVVKKKKRKPILRFKKYRTYRSKNVFIPSVTLKKKTELNSTNQGNCCLNIQPKPTPQPVYTPVSPIPERAYSEDLNESVGYDNTSHASDRQSVSYSPPPYQSPKRESLGVPIIRASVTSEIDVPKSLNVSRNSSKHNLSLNSAYGGNFTSPMYLGSSTPIHRHWTEHTNRGYCNTTISDSQLFDTSNNFGFEILDDVDEPIVSPIKKYETPLKVITPRKPSPIKIPFGQVVRMLKFGPDPPEEISQDNEQLNIDQLLPPTFLHDGSTPSYSPPSTPPDPVMLKKCCKSKKSQNLKKKKVVILEEFDDSDFATQSSEDKTSQDDEIQRNEKTFKRALRSNQSMNTTKINLNLSKNLKSNDTLNSTRRKVCFDDSDIDKDIGYETEVSPNKKTKLDVSKQPRRSYERPPYHRGKKYGRKDFDEDENKDEDEEEETVVKSKPQPKKKNALSKKEELELEKWAKAFNEQCMQVESFNLVVE